MTRARKLVGRICFVGAGPGDPGLLTKRALDALSAASQVYYDRSLPEPLLSAVREQLAEGVICRPAEGSPSDVAKQLIAHAKDGDRPVRLIGGDIYPHAAVVTEVRAVSEAKVPFDSVPGVSHAAAVAAYAGMPPADYRALVEVDDVNTLEPAVLAAAVGRGTLVLSVDSGDLGAVRDVLLSGAVDGMTPVAVTGDVTGETQHTATSTVDTFVEAALGFAGRVVLTIGTGVDERDVLGWWENRPLYGWKVLVPRTKEQAGAMSERLRAYGAIPCEVPTIAVEPPRTPAQMERAVKGLVDGRYAWIVFTSVNAVRAIRERFEEHGLDSRSFGGVKIACIGEATAEAVRGFGIEPELVPSGPQSSEGLLEEFPPHDPILDLVGRVLLPRADIATEILAAGLVDRGWEIDDVTAYRTVRAAPPPADIRDAIKSGGFDAVLFTSSSTVRNLVGIAGKPHARTVVAVIGPATAETAREFGLRVDAQPEHSTVPDLVEALAEYASELKRRLAEAPVKTRRGAKVQGPTALRFR
ncbi:uroporphyrinogen-III synthase [Phytomonospora endophytica]|uniref:Uroporphyrinogen III methyltransferase/synthase n=1 Tax=Phytomonospora endophytica TaxID=714109 RepID=A0A841FNH4_9ACTN|nr:uroporphyrinogen-III synthase [Phytomonospora endophytica]MBB6037656.1 uroporphyrinogen III methyltransferase/synthase [Phytomonospora endophytica]GIG67819.1 bifunctional uroporphyrinogen-III C-methyltransferase/uroporphyrinogen-III synthase [Phytomonospora endophytica]